MSQVEAERPVIIAQHLSHWSWDAVTETGRTTDYYAVTILIDRGDGPQPTYYRTEPHTFEDTLRAIHDDFGRYPDYYIRGVSVDDLQRAVIERAIARDEEERAHYALVDAAFEAIAADTETETREDGSNGLTAAERNPSLTTRGAIRY